MSATKGRRTVLLYKVLFAATKVKSNLSYCTKICGVYTKTKGANVEGLWGNGVWGVGNRFEEKLQCV